MTNRIFARCTVALLILFPTAAFAHPGHEHIGAGHAAAMPTIGPWLGIALANLLLFGLAAILPRIGRRSSVTRLQAVKATSTVIPAKARTHFGHGMRYPSGGRIDSRQRGNDDRGAARHEFRRRGPVLT